MTIDAFQGITFFFLAPKKVFPKVTGCNLTFCPKKVEQKGDLPKRKKKKEKMATAGGGKKKKGRIFAAVGTFYLPIMCSKWEN